MKVRVLKESGYEESLLGMGLSFFKGDMEVDDFFTEKKDNLIRRSEKLSKMQGGHNKFIEHIELWVLVKAPLSWWKHADTYRMASKQSESTMHTLKHRMPLCAEDYSENVHPEVIALYNHLFSKNTPIGELADNLPDGFLQSRIWKMSYKTLQGVISQRKGHRLKHWDQFMSQVLNQVEHPELLQ